MAKSPDKKEDAAEDRFTLLSPALAGDGTDYRGFFDTPPDTIDLLPQQEKPGKRGAK